MIIPNLLDEIQADALPTTGTRIADNPFQAAKIANGLKLADCESIDECRACWRRYRGWRIAGENTAAAFQHAIDGKDSPAPMIPMTFEWHGDYPIADAVQDLIHYIESDKEE